MDTSDADWSALPAPALALISARLAASSSAVDYVNFRSVCTSWCAAAPKRPQLPCLVGHQRDGTGGQWGARGLRTVYTFYAFNGVSWSPIAAFPEPIPLGASFSSSSRGWLALSDINSNRIFLWNPVTGSRIRLPPVDGFPNKVVLSSDPGTSTDCVVFLNHSGRTKLSFCRPGYSYWTPIETPPHLVGLYDADIVFHRGLFYLACNDLKMYLFDVKMLAELKEIPMVRQVEDPELPARRPLSELECYLLESCGELLLVTIKSLFNYYSAQVFQLVWVGEQVMMSKQQNLGDRAVFVGKNDPFSICADEFPGCRRNCIYRAYAKDKFVMVIHLEDGRNELLPNRFADSDWRPCAWLTPTLL